MSLLFSILTILPLVAFVSDPLTYSWTPWVSFAILMFGCFILIPTRRFLFTIPIAIPLIVAFFVLMLLEVEWARTVLLIAMALALWHWFHLTAVNEVSNLIFTPRGNHPPRMPVPLSRSEAEVSAALREADYLQYTPTLLLFTLLTLVGATFAANAFAIYIAEPITKITILYFLFSIFYFLSFFKILLNKQWILPSLLMSIVSTELLLVTFYFPISFFSKSIISQFPSFLLIDLFLRHQNQSLTTTRVRVYLLTYLALTAAILSTAAWI